jgi:hypothetical protein
MKNYSWYQNYFSICLMDIINKTKAPGLAGAFIFIAKDIY